MSGIALLWQRDGAPVEAEQIAPMVRALGHRGPDGSDLRIGGGVALAHLHHWTTPEEVGERQPVSDREAGFDLAFDGRLDNREWLVQWLHNAGRELDLGASDAVLAAAAYACWGEGCFERFLGPFAVVVADRRRRRVVCARDVLGSRDLVYHLGPDRFLVASEECGILARPEVSRALDERSVASFLAVREPPPDATFFSDVRRLPPGSLLVVARVGSQIRTFAQVEPTTVRYRRDDDYVERFSELVRESVRVRLRTAAPPAVLMSGGLDSTTVAALAARQLGGGAPLTAVSWIFEELRDSDERPYIDAMVDHCGLAHVRIPADDAWPLRDGYEWVSNPNQPAEDLYRVLHLRTYRALQQTGSHVLLSGAFGDHLWFGGEYWLRDLLREKRMVGAGVALFHALHSGPYPASMELRKLAVAAARCMGRGGRRRPKPEWLTGGAASLLGEHAAPRDASEAEWRSRSRAVAPSWGPLFAAAERTHAARSAIELRDPYRDLRLVEFMAGVPAHLLERPGWSKWLLRRAMRGILPETVRLRRWASSLAPLARRGLAERESLRSRSILTKPDALWPRYVRRDWIEPRLPGVLVGHGASSLVPWLCICIEIWNQRVTAAGLQADSGAFVCALAGGAE